MAITLVVNPGSSTKKYSFYENRRAIAVVTLAKGVESIEVELLHDSQQNTFKVSESGCKNGLDYVLTLLKERSILNTSTLTSIGVRTVLPGKKFQSHMLIDDEFIKEVASKETLAPLHVPPLLKEVQDIKKIFPDVKIVAVSDSAFHNTLPESSYRYSIEDSLYSEYQVRRYGYHGLSVQSVVRIVTDRNVFSGKNYIVCHIGSGVSLTAIKNGKSIDTTMGFTPGSGMVMASRSGDIESGALLEIMRIHNFSVSEMQTYLQTKGGLFALTGEADFRHLIERYACGDEVAIRALQVFVRNFKKQLGGLVAVLGSLHGVVVTGTAGERSALLREVCFSGLEVFNIEVDTEQNEQLSSQVGFFHKKGAIPLYVCKTREMDEIARLAESF